MQGGEGDESGAQAFPQVIVKTGPGGGGGEGGGGFNARQEIVLDLLVVFVWLKCREEVGGGWGGVDVVWLASVGRSGSDDACVVRCWAIITLGAFYIVRGRGLWFCFCCRRDGNDDGG